MIEKSKLINFFEYNNKEKIELYKLNLNNESNNEKVKKIYNLWGKKEVLIDKEREGWFGNFVKVKKNKIMNKDMNKTLNLKRKNKLNFRIFMYQDNFRRFSLRFFNSSNFFNKMFYNSCVFRNYSNYIWYYWIILKEQSSFLNYFKIIQWKNKDYMFNILYANLGLNVSFFNFYSNYLLKKFNKKL